MKGIKEGVCTLQAQSKITRSKVENRKYNANTQKIHQAIINHQNIL
jgi:hypothetical protein